MSLSSDVSLGSLRLQAKQRCDMLNNPFISDAEWNGYASQSYKELYDMLISAYGNDYYVATTYQFTTTNQQAYSLPDGSTNFHDTTGSVAAKFYKLLGVDLQYSSSPSGFVSLKRFEFIERNKYAYPNTSVNFVGYTNMRYRLQGNNLYLVPIPMTGQTCQVWYAPAPTSLQYMIQGGLTLSSTTVTVAQTVGLSIGMTVNGTSIPDNSTILSLASTSFIISNAATSTKASTTLSIWSDSTTLDGISGWEEYIIVDMCIKAKLKQEDDPQGFMLQKNELKARIEAMAEGRDIGQAFHVSDVVGANGLGDPGGPYGSGGLDGGWY